MTVKEAYKIDVRFTTRTHKTQRTMEVAEAFGLGMEDSEFVVFDNLQLEIADGDIVYITGQSGGGKSVLLRELQKQMAARGKTVVNLDQVVLEEVPLIEQFGKTMKEATQILGVAGIADAYIYNRLPSELSDGQRYRAKLAKAIETGAQVWAADEFMAVLDRTSAKCISSALQKMARRVGATVMVATTHTDLTQDLAPNVVVTKRFREKIKVDYANQ